MRKALGLYEPRIDFLMEAVLGRFEEWLIEAKDLKDRGVYVSSWRENGDWRAMVTERAKVADSTREFTGTNRDEAVRAAEDDFEGR